jgi:aminopeptidase YwaD
MRRVLTLLAALCAACASPRVSADPVVAVSELRAHVEWLADDAREGRRAGTAGERAAASYIAREFARAGLLPAGEEGSWFQEFEVEMAPQPGACALRVDGQPVTGVGTLACSADGDTAGPLAATSAPGVVVLIRHVGDGGALRGALRAAAEAGAVAAVVGVPAESGVATGDGRIAFDAVPGRLALPVVTVAAADFAALEARCRDGEAPAVALSAAVQRPTAIARNVLGIAPGTGPDLIVVGAHFDHLGWGGEGSLAPGTTAIHNGADDNASGTAVLIEVGEEWGRSAIGANPREVGVLFAAWSAEELGLLGSMHWVAHPTVELSRVRANLNLDMVGRVANGAITVGSAETAAAFRPALAQVQERLDASGAALELAIAAGQLPGGGGSDHMSFQSAGIPALFFFSGLHADYHKPGDDAEKVDYEGMRAVAEAVSHLLIELQQAERASLAYVKPAAPAGGEREMRRPGIWFGSIPDYAAAPEGGGMQIAGTSPGSPAEKAGLQPGDVIKQLGDVAIGDIYDFMDALAGFANGQTVQVTVLRKGKTLTLPLTFFPRPTTES